MYYVCVCMYIRVYDMYVCMYVCIELGDIPVEWVYYSCNEGVSRT